MSHETPERLAWRREYAKRNPQTILRHRLTAALNLLQRHDILTPATVTAARRAILGRRWDA